MHQEGVPSVARVAGHPIHPMLIPFPIAFLSALPVTDYVGWRTGDPFWLQASWWLCVAGLVTAAAAAGAGSLDFWGRKQVRRHKAAWIHFFGNAIAILTTGVNFWLRLNDSPTIPIPWGLPLSLGTFAILGITGWYGGELAYRHGVGAIPDDDC